MLPDDETQPVPTKPTGAIDGTAMQPADAAMAKAIAEAGGPAPADNEAPVAADTPAATSEDEPAGTDATEEATADEEEDLPPSTVHPAAPAGFTEKDVDPEKGEFYIGQWYDKANYGCPFCHFATIVGPGAVELHILGLIDSGDIKHREYTPTE